MRYINTLREDNAALRKQLEAADRAIQQLFRYYQSEKFYEHDYAYVRTDLLPRLSTVRDVVRGVTLD